jgi:hypothetical protein
MIPDFLETEKFLPSVGYVVIQATYTPSDASDIRPEIQKNTDAKKLKSQKITDPVNCMGLHHQKFRKI